MAPAERCAFCLQTNLTWLDDGTPVCGHHFVETQDGTIDLRVRRTRENRMRISAAAERLLRDAAE